jgi:oxygen-independent coproporphyrinogen-3 oxidase
MSWAMQQDGLRSLARAGYVQYEVSAYASGERRCVHNQNYWRFGDYLGIGAGAHGKVTDLDSQIILRRSKKRQPNEYMAGAGSTAAIADEHTVEAGQVVVEFMMNALRLTDGFSPDLFEQRTGLPIAVLAPTLEDAVAQGFLDVGADWIRPTEIGHRYLNELLYLFLQCEGRRAGVAG